MAEVRDELIELNGLRFHYRDWAGLSAEAPDLVLLHGFTGHARTWDTAAAALSADYRVLALDQRGHGESAWANPDSYEPDQMADDLAAFATALGLRSFTLIGLSMGGTVATAYAGRRPPELARLVIVDIGPELAPDGRDRILARLNAPAVFDGRDEVIQRLAVASPNSDAAEVRHRAEHNLMRLSDGRWTWRWDRAFRNESVALRTMMEPTEAWRRLANIRVPTLLVRGELSDVLSSEMAHEMIRTVPDCRFIEVPGAGHPVPADRPEGFLRALRTFL